MFSEKILKDCGSSTRPRVNPKGFPSTHSSFQGNAIQKRMTYHKAYVGTPIIDKSDYTMVPKGSVVISSSYRKIRNIVSHIEEHHFEVPRVKHADGRIESMFLLMKDDARTDIYDEIVPGTRLLL